MAPFVIGIEPHGAVGVAAADADTIRSNLMAEVLRGAKAAGIDARTGTCEDLRRRGRALTVAYVHRVEGNDVSRGRPTLPEDGCLLTSCFADPLVNLSRLGIVVLATNLNAAVHATMHIGAQAVLRDIPLLPYMPVVVGGSTEESGRDGELIERQAGRPEMLGRLLARESVKNMKTDGNPLPGVGTIPGGL